MYLTHKATRYRDNSKHLLSSSGACRRDAVLCTTEERGGVNMLRPHDRRRPVVDKLLAWYIKLMTSLYSLGGANHFANKTRQPLPRLYRLHEQRCTSSWRYWDAFPRLWRPMGLATTSWLAYMQSHRRTSFLFRLQISIRRKLRSTFWARFFLIRLVRSRALSEIKFSLQVRKVREPTSLTIDR